MSSMVEIIQKIVRDEMAKRYVAELGVVTSIFPHSGDSDKDNYECNVQLKYRDLELRKVPVATQHIGLANVPKVGELVLLSFVNGNINSPIVVGRLYTDEDRPPVNQGEEFIYVPPYSKNPDLRRLHVELPSGLTVSVTDDLVDVQAGDTRMKMNRDGSVSLHSSGAMKISAAGDLEIEAKNLKIKTEEAITTNAKKTIDLISDDNIQIITQKNMAFTVSDTMQVDAGSDFNVTAAGNSKTMIGSQMEISAGSTGKILAAGPLTIKGAQVQLNPPG